MGERIRMDRECGVEDGVGRVGLVFGIVDP